VRDSRGFDYTGYKRPTLVRRFQKRMDVVDADDYAAYREYLEREPEFAELFDTILINVTGFFRDPAAWDHLAAEVVPAIIDRADDRQIRIRSAGCASGAEAYTIVNIFAEAARPERVPRAGQDLRDRSRRRRPPLRAARCVHREGDQGRSRGVA
jgi:two-component system CheB/CheR fusion protein